MRREFRVELVRSERDADFTALARLISDKIMIGFAQYINQEKSHIKELEK